MRNPQKILYCLPFLWAFEFYTVQQAFFNELSIKRFTVSYDFVGFDINCLDSCISGCVMFSKTSLLVCRYASKVTDSLAQSSSDQLYFSACLVFLMREDCGALLVAVPLSSSVCETLLVIFKDLANLNLTDWLKPNKARWMVSNCFNGTSNITCIKPHISDNWVSWQCWDSRYWLFNHHITWFKSWWDHVACNDTSLSLSVIYTPF